ncbi:6-bladed beta-propeller [Kosmotoga pacifica]|uniref:6-bladed beta-propeller n=1 Tax=Kosmotoga pacifica TaxID=1330330 RepID=UPI00069B5B55|nr:6-bladed beta-propeller [Kosmotoga pacifica]
MKSVVISIIVCLAFLAGCNVLENPGTGEFELFNEEPEGIVIEVLIVEATLVENGKEVIVATSWGDVDILRDADINEVVHYVAMNIEATLTNIFFHTGEITLTAIEFPYTCKIPSGKLHINLPIMPIETLRQVRFTYDVGYRHPTDEKYIVEPVIKIIEVIPNTPPLAPSEPSPPDGAVDVLCESIMSWECSDPDGDPLLYDVYFGESNPPPLIFSGISENSFGYDLSPGLTYYWKIVAKDNYGGITEGPLWTFKTELPNRPPEIPLLILPKNESTVSGPEVEFLWECIDPDGDLLLYDFYLAPELKPFGLPDLEGYPEDNLSIPLEELSPEFGFWRWKVVAKDGKGGVSESEVQMFYRNRPPEIPLLILPENESAVSGPDIEFLWECIDLDGDSLLYDFYLAPEAEPFGLPYLVDYPENFLLIPIEELPPEFEFWRWKVVAKDGKGGVSESEVCVFTVFHEVSPIGIWGEYGSEPGQFHDPIGICIDTEGYFYVADAWFDLDYGNHRVQKFFLDGTFFTMWGEGWGDYVLKAVCDIEVDSSDSAYVIDAIECMVKVFKAPPGQTEVLFVQEWGQPGEGLGEFNMPMGIGHGGEPENLRTIYVADTGNHRIQKFTLKWLYEPPIFEIVSVIEWGGFGSGPGQFNSPIGVAVLERSGYEEDLVYVTDEGNKRIQVFNNYGEYLFEWGELGEGPGQFMSVWGIAVTPNYGILDPLVYVTDPILGRVQIFNMWGEYITQIGRWGTAPGEFREPYGVAVDYEGFIYVADTGNQRIQKFAPIW